jgi:DNA-binding MarR family transcriptional regulator
VRPTGDGLLGAIVRLNLAVTKVLDEITGQAGITMPDYLVLGVVRGTPGHRSSPTAICDVLGRTTGGMSLTLDRLEDSGWVRRSPDPDDRRRVVVELTPTGLDLATRVNVALHAWERSLSLPGDHRETLARIDGVAAAIQDRFAAVDPAV